MREGEEERDLICPRGSSHLTLTAAQRPRPAPSPLPPCSSTEGGEVSPSLRTPSPTLSCDLTAPPSPELWVPFILEEGRRLAHSRCPDKKVCPCRLRGMWVGKTREQPSCGPGHVGAPASTRPATLGTRPSRRLCVGPALGEKDGGRRCECTDPVPMGLPTCREKNT